MLTAHPTPDELTGETAALAMFRANRQPVTPVPGIGEPGLGGTGLGEPGLGASGTREFEPFALGPSEPGVPGVPGPGALPIPGPRMPGAPDPEPPVPGGPTIPGPRIPGPRPSSRRGRRVGLMAAAVTLAAAAGFVVAAYTEALPGPLQQAAYHALGSSGSAIVSVSDLTTNAVFRLKGPDGALSRPVLVIVLPPVSASVSSSSTHAGVVTADSPLAAPGDTVVLQVQFGARWLSVQKGHLNSASQAGFLVRLRATQSVYRVVLLPTASHGISVSNAVTVSPR
jgi:hypothetical protein